MAAAKTTEQWQAVISDLSRRHASAAEQAQKLKRRKAEISLDAAMGSDTAKRELSKLNGELSRIAAEAEDLAAATGQAEAQQQEAAAREAEAGERKRLDRMGELSAAAIKHAAEFTAALQQAARAGAAVREAAHAMLSIAHGDHEVSTLNRVAAVHPYMRAAEFAGMRRFIEFQGYPGEPRHIQPLEREVAAILADWLPTAPGKEK